MIYAILLTLVLLCVGLNALGIPILISLSQETYTVARLGYTILGSMLFVFTGLLSMMRINQQTTWFSCTWHAFPVSPRNMYVMQFLVEPGILLMVVVFMGGHLFGAILSFSLYQAMGLFMLSLLMGLSVLSFWIIVALLLEPVFRKNRGIAGIIVYMLPYFLLLPVLFRALDIMIQYAPIVAPFGKLAAWTLVPISTGIGPVVLNLSLCIWPVPVALSLIRGRTCRS